MSAAPDPAEASGAAGLRPWWPYAWAVLAAGAFVAGVIAPIVDGYFFLFDDYRLFGQADTMGPKALLTRVHFGYFRPLVHGVAALEMAAFGWESPSALAAVSALLHALASGLVGRLARSIGASVPAAVVAAVVFFVAPWTIETLGWASCRFDLWCTAAVLFSVERSVVALGAGRFSMIGLGALWIALAAKETAAVTPVLVWLCVRAASVDVPGGALRRYLMRTAVLIGLWLAIRAFMVGHSGVPDPLGGQRGNLLALLASPATLSNLIGHIGSVLWPPTPPSTAARAVVALAGLSVAVGVGLALSRRRRFAGPLLVAALLVLAPALWLERVPGLTTSGRLAYLPTAFVAIVIALGWTSLTLPRARDETRAPRTSRWTAAIALGIWLLGALTSGAYQAEMWRQSSATARSAIKAFEPWVDSVAPLHITNLPYLFRQGPLCLKEYSFEWYYGTARVPDVTATRRVLQYTPGGAEMVAGWGAIAAPEGARAVRLKGLPGAR